jgi:hypothetical protein
MLDLSFDYETCIRLSERVAWRLDDVMPPDTRLDFTRRFLPDALVATESIRSLTPHERLKLNQITGNAYLNVFQFLEEFILVMAVDHARAEMAVDPEAFRALVRFAEEEAKHQKLFGRYRAAFDRDIGHPCGVIKGQRDVAKTILSKNPIAVLLITCHIELMTVQHYAACVRDDFGVDPLFATLLKCHWLEEAQHAKIDALELDKRASLAGPETIDAAIDEYLGLCSAFDGLLKEQAALDVESLGAVTGRPYAADEAQEIALAQHSGYRKTFLWFGMTNATFVDYVEKLSAEGSKRVAAHAKRYAYPLS